MVGAMGDGPLPWGDKCVFRGVPPFGLLRSNKPLVSRYDRAMNGTPRECVWGYPTPAYLRKVFQPETLGLDFVRNLFANGWSSSGQRFPLLL
jgi:hypothetical protein